MTNEKVYALFLETNDSNFLSVQYASSLEEAFAMARLEYARTIDLMGVKKGQDINMTKIGLFTIKTLPEMIGENSSFREEKAEATKVVESLYREKKKTEIKAEPKPKMNVEVHYNEAPKEEDPNTEKNELMKKIIKDKDIKLYRKNIKLFTDEERSYIRKNL